MHPPAFGEELSGERNPLHFSLSHRCRYFTARGVITLPPLNSDILHPRARLGLTAGEHKVFCHAFAENQDGGAVMNI